MNELTAIQKATLNMIKQFYLATFYPPTIRDIASITGISTKAVQDRVNGLRAKGYMAHNSKLIPKGVKVIINDQTRSRADCRLYERIEQRKKRDRKCTINTSTA